MCSDRGLLSSRCCWTCVPTREWQSVFCRVWGHRAAGAGRGVQSRHPVKPDGVGGRAGDHQERSAGDTHHHEESAEQLQQPGPQ